MTRVKLGVRQHRGSGQAGPQPVRVAEADALSMAFGMPMLALWYLPVAGEPWSVADMRRRLEGIDSLIATLERSLHSTISGLADQQFERLRVVEALNEAAKASERGDLEDLNLDAEATQALAEGLDPDSYDRRIRSLPPEQSKALRNEQLEAIRSGEPQRLASEAFRMYQAGASQREIGEFLARSMPPDMLGSLATAAQIVAETLGSAQRSAEDVRGNS